MNGDAYERGLASVMARRLVVAAALATTIVVVAVAAAGAATMRVALAHSSAAAAHGLDPALRGLATRSPRRRVSVIVQFQPGVPPGRAESIVRAHGGRGLSVVPLIHGVAATTRARAARALARLDDVHAVSLNAVMHSQTTGFDPAKLATWFNQSASTQNLWSHDTGTGIGVAVVDSGVQGDLPDFDSAQGDGTSRVIASAVVNPNALSAGDEFGHGTMVAGLVAGNGDERSSGDPLFGHYAGSAPDANIVSIKVSDDQGNATVLDALNGIQFAIDHKSAYNIRVLNLSLESDSAQSYTTDPLDAAVEAAWFDGITVVVAAGNRGGTAGPVDYAPANDPYVITVGAVGDHSTVNHLVQAMQVSDKAAEAALAASNQQQEQALAAADHQAEQALQQTNPQAVPALKQSDQTHEQAQVQSDAQAQTTLQATDHANEQALAQTSGLPASWSSAGTTQDGFAEPDVYAPGRYITSALSPDSAYASECSGCTVSGQYLTASGTSLAAPIVAGAAADLLQAHPSWTPAMVKGALTHTDAALPGYPGGSAGLINAYAALGADPAKLMSDTGLTPSSLVVIGSNGQASSWDRSSWSRSSWSTAQGALSAPWARSSWSCACSPGHGSAVASTRSSWSALSWTVDFDDPLP